MGIQLPPETDALFTDFEYSWGPEDREALSSQYPNFVNSVKRGQVDEIELDMFLAKFDNLYLPPDRDSQRVRRSMDLRRLLDCDGSG